MDYTWTELDCVNLMLSVIGEAPVSTLEVTGLLEVSVAKQVLKEVLIETLSKGWAWNTEEDYPVVPDVSGFINLPPTLLRLDAMNSEELNVVQRGTRLYDKQNHTFVFTKPVKLEVVLGLEYVDLPVEAKLFIAIRSARKFQKRFVSSDQLEHYTADDEAMALVGLRDADSDSADYNILTDSHSVASILRR